MPSVYNSGGTVYDFGLHYDDSSNPNEAGYDFSYGSLHDIWLRGQAIQTLGHSVRYEYWSEGACRVRARLQENILGQWVDEYSFDIDYLHVKNPPPYVGFTQIVNQNSDWFDVVVGQMDYCMDQQGLNSHMEMIPSTVVARIPKNNDTCWTNGSQCNIGLVRKNDLVTGCPPGNWSGYAYTSGPYYRYKCEEWSIDTTHTDGDPVFALTTT